jgi:hypothetical protein
MEDWEIDFEWLKVRHYVQNSMKRGELPDLNVILLLVGVQEFGRVKEKFTKEEKQDLMHIAVCRLLYSDGIFEFVGRDADGWPHWKQVIAFDVKGIMSQERYLKEKLIQYFKEEERI